MERNLRREEFKKEESKKLNIEVISKCCFKKVLKLV